MTVAQLVTCGGPFIAAQRHDPDNVVGSQFWSDRDTPPVVALGTHGGKIYAGDLTGSVYSFMP